MSNNYVELRRAFKEDEEDALKRAAERLLKPQE